MNDGEGSGEKARIEQPISMFFLKQIQIKDHNSIEK